MTVTRRGFLGGGAGAIAATALPNTELIEQECLHDFVIAPDIGVVYVVVDDGVTLVDGVIRQYQYPDPDFCDDCGVPLPFEIGDGGLSFLIPDGGIEGFGPWVVPNPGNIVPVPVQEGATVTLIEKHGKSVYFEVELYAYYHFTRKSLFGVGPMKPTDFTDHFEEAERRQEFAKNRARGW